MTMIKSMRIKKGDTVEVIAGKDRGKRGKVLRTHADENRVVVDGVNIVTKHIKSRRAGVPGERVQFPGKISVSNVMLVCPHTDKLTRIAYKVTEGGEKVRVSKKSGKEI